MRLSGQMRYVFDRIWDTPPERPREHLALGRGATLPSAHWRCTTSGRSSWCSWSACSSSATLALNTIVDGRHVELVRRGSPGARARALRRPALARIALGDVRRGVPCLAEGAAGVGRRGRGRGDRPPTLFTLGRWLLGLYLTSSSVGSAFGAAGSLVVFLVWLNYSSQIILFGAELTRAWTYRFGSKSGSDAMRASRAAAAGARERRR